MRSSLVSAMIHAVIIGLVVLLTPSIGHTRQAPRERSLVILYHSPTPPPRYTSKSVCQCGIGPRTIDMPTDLRHIDLPPIDATLAMPTKGVGESAVDTSDGPSRTGEGANEAAASGPLSADVVDVPVTPYPGASSTDPCV